MVLVVVALVAAVAARVEPASACSCPPIADPRRTLLEADGAFIGRLVERRRTASVYVDVFVFRVEQAVKGDIGPVVEVLSSSSGASCGLEVNLGQLVGLFL